MAAAGNKDSTIVWISWRNAIADLKLALSAYGSSETLAEELLAQWIGTRKIPWDCEVWKDPVAEVIALVEQTNRMGKTYVPVASTAHHKRDPEWFLLPSLKINSQESEARDPALGGAKASGITISHTHFLACLHTLALPPEAPREREETPAPPQPVAEQKVETQVWFDGILKSHPRQPGEQTGAYARRLYPLMPANVTNAWTFNSLRRRLYDK